MSARLRRKFRHPPWFRWTSEGHGLVAVDLGKRKVGVAVFSADGELARAKTVHTQRGKAKWDPWVTSEAVAAYVYETVDYDPTKLDWVCEWPEIRPGERKNTHNIRTLQQVGSRLMRLLDLPGWAAQYNPFEWKRNVDKKLHHTRIFSALYPAELSIWATLGHDARDAVGIGLFALGRIDNIGRTL